jgi:hypothetical protein
VLTAVDHESTPKLSRSPSEFGEFDSKRRPFYPGDISVPIPARHFSLAMDGSQDGMVGRACSSVCDINGHKPPRVEGRYYDQPRRIVWCGRDAFLARYAVRDRVSESLERGSCTMEQRRRWTPELGVQERLQTLSSQPFHRRRLLLAARQS